MTRDRAATVFGWVAISIGIWVIAFAVLWMWWTR
jgi:hypothetical protein